MNKKKFLISIFIPTGNRVQSLKIVLDSLLEQTYKNFEVLIVDYKSDHSLHKLIDTYKEKMKILLINQEKKGLARAANQALEKAVGDIFVRTDDDVKFSTHWLEAINETFASSESVGGVTGPTVIPSEYQQSRDLFFYTKQLKEGNFFLRQIGKIFFNFLLEGKPYRVSHFYRCGAFSLGSNYENALKEPIQEVDNLEACNLAVKTSLLKKIGGFDLNFGGIGDYHEPDAARRIMETGYKLLFNPKAALNHLPSQDGFFQDRPGSYIRMRNFIKFYFRHIKLDGIDKLFRFAAYLLFLNAYYFFQFLNKRQINQLGAIPATLIGLSRAIVTRK